MKKILLGTLSALAMTSGAIAHSNTMGTPYLGLGLGGMTTHHHVTGSTYNSAANMRNGIDTHVSKQSFAGELLAGWMWTMHNNFVVGGELGYSMTANETETTVNNNGGNADRLKVKSNWAFNGAVRVGYMVSKSTMLYARAGFEYRKFDTKFMPGSAGNTATTIDASNSKTAFAPGLGMEVSLTPHWSLGGEFRSAYFGSSTNSGTRGSEITVKPRVDTYMLNVKYKFWPTHKH